MMSFLIQWIAWVCFLIAVVSISGAIVRFNDNGLIFNPLLEIFVCLTSSICLTIWYKFKGGRSGK